MAKSFACMNVGHVHFNDGALQDGQRITDAVTVVRPCACIDHDCVDLIGMRLVNFFGHGTFKIGLKAFHMGTQIFAKLFHLRINFVQGGGAVLGGITLAKHVQVDAVQTQNFHDRPQGLGWQRSLGKPWNLRPEHRFSNI